MTTSISFVQLVTLAFFLNFHELYSLQCILRCLLNYQLIELASCLQVNRTTLRTKIAIPETIRQDKGNYKLLAENCWGIAQHVIRVEILGEKNVSLSES